MAGSLPPHRAPVLNAGARHNDGVSPGGDWARYWRAPDRDVEAMHAHFVRHAYDRHSHETYSFGITESGAQAFTCRGGSHTSSEGMVMAFNPDEPHDGHAATDSGFTYKIVHIGPEQVADVLADRAGAPAGLPLFVEPVRHDPALATALRRLYSALVARNTLARDEALASTVTAMVDRGPGARERVTAPGSAGARRAMELLRADSAREFGMGELAAVAGCSRYALHRAFVAECGLAPSAYQRQLRLRAARKLLAAGHTAAAAAIEAGFADQAHLTRWFRRCYGITPAAYARAATHSSGTRVSLSGLTTS
ncbi:MAG: helix-turn-helix domain-containing protein [Pseudonocardiaceae bacterium]|nr:helix-turn-helix domain-containing protein [Pseudonocardiaceae bacterium]